MNFLHPWAIALGTLGAALPLMIHWLTRPRPVRLPLSTIRFVRELVQQRRARKRLRDFLVLLLRVLAVLLLALAIARPQWGQQPLISPDDTGAAARVVLLDVSQSMAAESHGVQLLERARPLAAGFLASQTELQADLILAGTTAHATFGRLSTNFLVLRNELSEVKPRPERLNVQAALNKAGELLAAVDGAERRRELVVISDFQRTNWASADFSVLPEDTRIQLESVAPAQPLANLAILRIGTPDRVEQGREARLEVDVGNYSPTPRQVQVEIVLGEAVYRAEGLCPAQTRTTLSTEVPLRSAGWQTGEARLVNVQDALAADNVRPFVLDVRPAPTYALLTSQLAEQVPSSSYYLERALSPMAGRTGRPEARVVRINANALDRDALATTDVLVLDHPGRLSEETIRLLATLLRRGRGIFYVAAEPQDAVNLQLLADAAGADLQLPVTFAPPPAGQRRRNLFLVDVRREQAPFRIFGDELTAVTGSLRFSGGLATQRRERALADDILATYSDRSICLVVSTCAEGTLAVLNADLATSNLPSSPAFVPLMGELMGRLLARRRGADALACGEPVAVYLPTTAGVATGLHISGPPSAGDDLGMVIEESGGVLWRCPSLNAPGVYRVSRQGQTVFALAAALPAEEADLTPLEPTVLRERLAGGRKVHYRAQSRDDEEHDDLWSWLAVACVGCVLGEFLTLKAFRS
jgi:hypothetical protein